MNKERVRKRSYTTPDKTIELDGHEAGGTVSNAAMDVPWWMA